MVGIDSQIGRYYSKNHLQTYTGAAPRRDTNYAPLKIYNYSTILCRRAKNARETRIS